MKTRIGVLVTTAALSTSSSLPATSALPRTKSKVPFIRHQKNLIIGSPACCDRSYLRELHALQQSDDFERSVLSPEGAGLQRLAVEPDAVAEGGEGDRPWRSPPALP
jgi:hypothetical protein